jgi:hypothetical protein
MTPHILIEPELIHLFDNDEERDNLCLEIVDVVQSSIRAECDLATRDIRPDAYGFRVVSGTKLDVLCERIAPKLNTITEEYLNKSKYSDKIIAEVHVNRNKLSVYLSAKYYTGVSSSIH